MVPGDDLTVLGQAGLQGAEQDLGLGCCFPIHDPEQAMQ